LVAGADERDIDASALDRLAGLEAHVASASRNVGRSGSGCASGEGMRWLTPTDISGLMPHVTTGSMDAPSIFLTSSNAAPGSLATLFHHAAARSNASPDGAYGLPRR